jgi:hypothetical protein
MSEFSPLADLLSTLPLQHRLALSWFDENAGRITGWPGKLDGRTLLTTKAKGIYKPVWSEYALSVRHSMGGPYPDGPVEEQADGLWSFRYFQEGLDLSKQPELFTNRGLLKCWADVVPVGVLYQLKEKPDPKYRVLGLALVAGFEEGHFLFQGISRMFVRDGSAPEGRLSALVTPQQRANEIATYFDPRGIEDARRATVATIYRRQGQPGFRARLLNAYGGRCSVTGYDAADALEAAHIVPYRGPVTNHPSNGLLLRSDLHSLFDLGLVAVDTRAPGQCFLLMDANLRSTAYSKFSGVKLNLPADPALQPSVEALRIHREMAGI